MSNSEARNSLDFGPVWMLLFWVTTSMCWWALAFWPTMDAESWISRTQLVCFGKMPGQLLPFNGWILLFGGPLLLLVSLFVVYNTELIESLTHIYKKKKSFLFFWIFILFFLMEIIWVGFRIREDYKISNVNFTSTEIGRLPKEYPVGEKVLPNFSLVDQFGTTITPQYMQGKTVIMSFVFAHCSTVCPTLVRQVTGAMAKTDSEKTIGILVTLDPWRDRPSTLKSMAEQWKLPENAHILSGKISDVVNLHKDFELPLKRDEKTGDVAHPSLVYVISPEGKIAYTFNNPPVSWLVEAVGRVQGR